MPETKLGSLGFIYTRAKMTGPWPRLAKLIPVFQWSNYWLTMTINLTGKTKEGV